MTEEQKTAIKFLEKRIEICIENANICDENDFDEEASQLREEQKHTETILNLIQQLQEENKKHKDLYNKALSDLVIDEKMIDEMAKYIACLDNNETICKKLYSEELCEDKKIVCWECAKQYFRNKAKKQIQ